MTEMYESIHDWHNILMAYSAAAAGKRGKIAAAHFEYRLEDNLITLQNDLREKTYQPGPYESFYIHDPKKRLISAAPFRDRVVHHALCNVIEPIFEKSFIHDSYANRIGKGTHRAIDRAQWFSRRFKYVLPCDVRQYFPSIDHQVLRKILARKIKDPDTLWLIDRILNSGIGVLKESYDMVYFPEDDLFTINRPRGLPIGNLTSQFWANCYLDGFDHFVKRELQCKGYVRYVDDMLLFGDDKKQLWKWKASLIKRLQTLRLTIHKQRAQVQPVRAGFPFLGFTLYPNKRRLKRRKGISFSRKLRLQARECAKGNSPFEPMIDSVNGWINHVRYGDTRALQEAILCPILHPLFFGRSDARHTPVHKNL